MNRTLPIAAVFMMVAMPALSGPASDAVQFFYVPVKWEADAQYRDRFTGPAKTLFDLNDTMPTDEIGCIDFGPGVDAQDFDDATIKKSLKLTEKVDGANATVTASFMLFPGHAEEGKREVQWSLVSEGGKWKIADIASLSSGWKLSELECLPQE